MPFACKNIQPLRANIQLQTDASNKGWVAVYGDQQIGGRWNTNEAMDHINITSSIFCTKIIRKKLKSSERNDSQKKKKKVKSSEVKDVMTIIAAAVQSSEETLNVSTSTSTEQIILEAELDFTKRELNSHQEAKQYLRTHYRKDSCISRTFLLKFWVKNCRCGLYTRPLI